MKKAYINYFPVTLVLTLLVLLVGCRTYFGYDTTERKNIVPGSEKLLTTSAPEYQMTVSENKLRVIANCQENCEVTVQRWEDRKYRYSKSQIWTPLVIIRYPFDFLVCWSKDWNLASTPPSMIRRVSYLPPICWFSCINPPYFTSPNDAETVVESAKIDETTVACVPRPVSKLETTGIVELNIAGKKVNIDLTKPEITREMLPKELLPQDEIRAIATYKGISQEITISTIPFLSSSEIFTIGSKLFNEKRTPKDQENGIHYIQIAAQQEYPDALYWLAKFYLNQSENTKQGVEYLKSAADHGVAAAAFDLAMIFEEGKLIASDRKSSIKYFEIAADKGYGRAQTALGIIYSNEYNFQEAIKYLEMAASQGIAVAQYRLALIYLGKTDLAVIQNLPEAKKWLQLAAEQNFPDAKQLLPDIIEKYNNYNFRLEQRKIAEEQFRYYAKISDPNIENVKNLIFPLDDTRSLQDALSCQMCDIKWRVFRSQEKRTIVEVVGRWNNENFAPKQQSQGLFTMMVSGRQNILFQLFPQKGEEVMAQFVIKPNGSVDFFYGEIRNKQGVVKKLSSNFLTMPAYTDEAGQYLLKSGFMEILYGRQ